MILGTEMALDLWIGNWRLGYPPALALGLLAVVPWIVPRGGRRILWPSLDDFPRISGVRAGPIRHLPNLLASLAILCMAVAMARPQQIGGREKLRSEGIAIEFVLDHSVSMAQEHFATNGSEVTRLEAARLAFEEFVRRRPDDLIGVVVFAGHADRLSAPTLDHEFVIDAARSIRPAGARDAGTNLGHAIALGLGELRAVKARRKVLILLTDGRNEPPQGVNTPFVAPEDAASLAPAFGVSLFTIAIGASTDAAGAPGVDVDLLNRLAGLGQGKAYVVKNTGELEQAYDDLDRLETSSLVSTVRTRYREGYPAWVATALVLLMVSRWLATGPLRQVP